MPATPPTSLIGKAFAIAGSIVLLVVAFMFSLVLLAVVAVVAFAAVGYFLWRTRHLRKAMKAARAQAGADVRRPGEPGQVIDGEAVVVDDGRTVAPRALTDTREREPGPPP